MSHKTDYEKKFLDVYGYPSIYFYKDGKFSKNKGSRSYDSLSKIINEEYLIKCLKINFRDIKETYNKEYLNNDLSRNLLIGFFKNNENYNIYDEITSDYLPNYIDYCYYCNDFDQYINKTINNMTINENIVLSYNKQKGNNYFYINDKDVYIKNDYISFIHNDVINSYEDIDKENKLIYLDFMKDKLSLVFVYNDTEQKNYYRKIGDKLFKMNSRKKMNIFGIILLNKNVEYNKFKGMKENNTYLINKKFKKIIELNNLDFIEEIIKNNNMKLKKEVESDIKYLFNNCKIVYSDDYNIYKFLLILSIIILVFYFLYVIFVKNNSDKETIYSELMKQSNKDLKIEIV